MYALFTSKTPSRASRAAMMQTSPTNISWSELSLTAWVLYTDVALVFLLSVFKKEAKFTHVPRTSLNSNICLMSSTCFFHESLAVSPFSWAMAETGRSADTSPLQQLPVTLRDPWRNPCFPTLRFTRTVVDAWTPWSAGSLSWAAVSVTVYATGLLFLPSV